MSISFEQFANNVAKLDAPLELKKAVEVVKVKAINLNKDKLLSGKDSNDKFLNPLVSDSYARYKYQNNGGAPFGVADLKLTGDFQDDFYGDVFKEAYGARLSINSSDRKRNILVKRDSVDIFGLTKSDDKEITETEVKPLYVENLKKALLRD